MAVLLAKTFLKKISLGEFALFISLLESLTNEVGNIY